MISLYIDTATSYPLISLIKDNEIKYLFNSKIDGDISVSIFSVLEEAFKVGNIEPDDIDQIYIVNGPGSFTGVRIGVTIAKVFAWTKNKNLIPLSTLKSYATTETEKEYIVSLIDARRGYVYAGIYDKELNVILKDSYISLEELKNQVPENSLYVSYDNFDFETSMPKIDVIRLINKYKTGVNPHSLNPNYCKLTEAEEKLGNKNDK